MSLIEESIIRYKSQQPNKEDRHLIDEVMLRLRPEDVKLGVEQQPRFRPLMKSIDWAIKRGEQKRLDNFKNELWELQKKVRRSMAHKWMAAMEASGHAIDIMPEEKAIWYMSRKNAMMIAYELLHSLAIDIGTFYNEQGFDFRVDEVNDKDPLLQKARELHDILDEQLKQRYEGDSILPEVRKLMEAEADRVYDYTMKRMVYFHKYSQQACEKYYAKKNKEDEHKDRTQE